MIREEEALKYLIRPIVGSTDVGKEKQKELDAYNMAIKALKQIKKIKSIINGPVCMQGYVPKYMDICEVLKEAEHDQK